MLLSGLFTIVVHSTAQAVTPVVCNFTTKVHYTPGLKNLPNPLQDDITITTTNGALTSCIGDPDLQADSNGVYASFTAYGKAAKPALTSCAAGAYVSDNLTDSSVRWNLVSNPSDTANSSSYSWNLASLAEQITQQKGGGGTLTGRYNGATFTFAVTSVIPGLGACSDTNGLQQATLTGVATLVR
ncbi:hypothetical protein [Streptomyces sp. NPDC059003]|uniref:hypothetical protein n=1 Tax=Streptomyces sp. NPDC059003 TaxID=3346691 RepID=UPI0036A099BF